MNFENLLTKLKTIDECGDMASSADSMLTGDMEECGDMGPSAPRQSDSVTMNVSMNGSGAGGIRDLLNVLKDIQDGSDHGHNDDVVFGMEDGAEGAEMPIADEFDNEPNPATAPASAVTPTGDDLASKGGEAEKVNGGGNPMGVDEALVARLSAMYKQIKESKKEKFDPLKHVKNPTKGEKEAAKDVKRGSYADRSAMLKSAEADGRLKD